MARHPNRQELASWLNEGHGHLDEHIDSCEKCAARLDELDATLPTSNDNVTAINDSLKPALLQLLQPPADLHERIRDRIAARLQDRSDADLFGSLLGIPIEAGKVFLDRPNPPRAN